MKNFNFHTSWLEINEENIKHNINVFRNLIDKKTKLGVVLKSNAYGHGLPEMLACVHDLVDIIHVITPEDALFIRNYEAENNLKPIRILVIGAINKEHVSVCIQNKIELVIYGNDWDDILSNHKSKKKIMAHIHLDTGLGREGFAIDSKELKELLQKHSEKIKLIGFMSHFANTEDVTEQQYAKKQLDHFHQYFKKNNFSVEKHIGASAATLILNESHHDAVRIGIALYGMWPSKETKLSYSIISKNKIELRPALEWKVKSQIVKDVADGSYIGYGCTYKCESKTKIAVFPVGYFDGFPRSLTNKAYVLINGQRCPMIGRVMMNHIVVDITKIQKNNNRVIATLLGQDGTEEIKAENIAAWCDTINYEVTTRIGGHLPRIIV